MIVGTAGHIDHGKTTLVRALTGVDTDRLPEEKQRGISIELGYAYTPAANGEVLGFIDVPGHEKFVHTMAAGAVGVGHALLVVAADDGVMPQTREHLAILGLLGVRQGSVALTKVDRVDAARVVAAKAEILALLAGTPLADAPVFETAATQPGDGGVAALRQHLEAVAAAWPGLGSAGLFRLAVDRVFTLAGQGTVVTGTVFSGQVRVGDVLQHSATGQAVRVRSLHAQNRAAEVGQAGQRCALNLAGIAREAISRGDWIADARVLRPTQRLDLRVRLLPDAPALGAWSAVHVHVGTAHHMAHLVPLQGDTLQPGAEALAQLVVDAPVFALPGDHLILRNAQASRTLGGGQVLDPLAPERRRRSAERLAWLTALAQLVETGEPDALVRHAPQGLGRSTLTLLMGREPDAVVAPDIRQLPAGESDGWLIAEPRWQALREQVLQALARHHERASDEPGPNAARLRRMALPGLLLSAHNVLWHGLHQALLAEGAVERSGASLHLPGQGVSITPAERATAERLLPLLLAGGFDPPWVRDLAKAQGLGEDATRALLRKLARAGELGQVVRDLFFPAATLGRLQATLAELAQQSPRGEVEAHAFRDATGLGRKRAIQILEYFDRIGMTRRVRDAHVLRAEANATPLLQSPAHPG
ncbi:MAG TPA: selenocysteine-specific translation elongation factor [Ideonella sp.]|uniref:selenocysteine-specific translation elongation factor n=1 Tax=Ideonella sp. TaxID=1929293 RepID=UPI002C116A2A|nr:selenocysteine-specific translation elongation factor [Ideonella sp.]HSI47394.1 selenocysteine-specific translation elongation factor [Ideonella sp.]